MTTMTAAGSGTGAVAAPAPEPVGKLGLFGWLTYEWASQPFYSLITTFLFAPYFANGFLSDPIRGQAIWGYAAAIAGLAIAVASPILGSLADASGRRKPWIFVSSLFFAAAMASLWMAEPGATDRLWLILAAYAVAAVCAELNSVYVNSMMPGLVPESQYGRYSGMSAAIGYLGGLIALVIVAGLLVGDATSGRTFFGLEPILTLDAAARQGDRLVGPFCAVWFLLFVLPLLLFTPDRQLAGVRPGGGLSSLMDTLRELARERQNILRFLIARMLYVDGLGAIFAFGGIYGAAMFGWQTSQLGLFGIILIVFAMVGAALGGFFDDKLGPRPVILAGLVVALIGTLGVLSVGPGHVLFSVAVPGKAAGSGFLTSAGEQAFVAFAAMVGFVAGPLNASSRSLMARLAPPDRITQFFGLLSFSGKATSFVAPFLVAMITTATGSQRLGVGVVLLFLLAGFFLMLRVQGPGGEAHAAAVSAAAPAQPVDWFGTIVVLGLVAASLAILFFLR